MRMTALGRYRGMEVTQQTGQVLAEAVVVLMILIILLFCILQAARMQWSMHVDLLEAHLHAQALASGVKPNPIQSVLSPRIPQVMSGSKNEKALSPSHLRLRPYASGWGLHRDAVQHGPAMDVHHEVAVVPHDRVKTRAMHPLLGGGEGWVHVRHPSEFAIDVWHFIGDGASTSYQETVNRMSKAERLWGRSARSSRRIVRRISTMTQRVDDPWGRVPPTTDWLSAWADISQIEATASTWWNGMLQSAESIGRKLLSGWF